MTCVRRAAKAPAGPSQALRTYFLFLELRHKVELYQVTGRVAECPVDEMALSDSTLVRPW